MTDFLVAALQITSTSNVEANFAEAEEQIELASRRGSELIGLPESVAKNEELVESLYRLVVQKETGEIGWSVDEVKWNGRQFVLVKIQVPSPYTIQPKSEIHEINVVPHDE